jgi:hypothetical protein
MTTNKYSILAYFQGPLIYNYDTENDNYEYDEDKENEFFKTIKESASLNNISIDGFQCGSDDLQCREIYVDMVVNAKYKTSVDKWIKSVPGYKSHTSEKIKN